MRTMSAFSLLGCCVPLMGLLIELEARTLRDTTSYEPHLMAVGSRVESSSPAVTLLAPNGGENLNEDLSFTIRWQAIDPQGVSFVRLFYSVNDGRSYTLIADSVTNTGRRLWRVPRTPTTTARVKVVAINTLGETAQDSSDAPFTILDVSTFVQNTSAIATTIRNDGYLGSGGGTFAPNEPSFEYPFQSKRHYLNLGQLLFAGVDDKGDTLATLLFADNFRPTTAIVSSDFGTYVRTTTTYRDKEMGDFSVIEQSYAFRNEQFILHFFRIRHTGDRKFSSFHIGLMADFDISGLRNLTGYDVANRVAFTYDATGEWSGYAGIRIMDEEPLSFRRYSGDSPANAAALYRHLAHPSRDDVAADQPNDYQVVLSSPSFKFEGGDSLLVAFAMAVGEGMTGLASAMQRAEQFWRSVKPTYGRPWAETDATSNITQSSATVSGRVRANGNVTTVKFEYGTTKDFGSEVIADQSPISGYQEVVVSARLTGLLANTPYYYRVAATSIAGTATGNDRNFTTTPAITIPVPLPPILSAPADGSTNLPRTITLSWNAVSNATAYHLQLGTDQTFASLAFEDSSLTATSVQVGPLDYGRVYYWRVRARNASGFGMYSNVWSFSTLAAPTISVMTPVGVWATGFTYSIAWSSSNLSGNVDIFLSTNGGASFVLALGNQPNTGSASWSIPSTVTPSNNCRLRVASVADSSIFGVSGSFTIVSGALPSTITANFSVSFPPSPTSSSDYRLLSLPGNPGGITMGEVLRGVQKFDWRAFRDNGATSNYLVELGPTATFQAGEGIWVLQKGTLNVTRSIPAITLAGDATAGIALRSGWNIIGNPFDKPVQWSAVLQANPVVLPAQRTLYQFNGSYSSATTLEPYRGYYFFNDGGPTTLRIPYPFGTARIDGITERTQKFDWRIQIVVTSDVNRDDENFLGIIKQARQGFDELEQFKPPIFLDQALVSFVRPDWNREYPYFGTDYRPSLGEGQQWEFDVRSTQRGSMLLWFHGLEHVPPTHSIVLLRYDDLRPVDLRQEQSIAFDHREDRTRFVLIVGPQNYVDETVRSLMPLEFTLSQNYPNPFNPETMLRVSLRSAASVQVEVYNLLGQHVRTLLNENSGPATRTITWDGRDEHKRPAPSGLYFCRMVVDGKLVAVRRMLLTK